MSELERLRWRCRRGLLELDLVLASFLDKYFATLSHEQREAFCSLLDYADNDLWDIITAKREVDEAYASQVVSLLRRVSCHS